MFITNLKVVKEVGKWRYNVALVQAPNGVYIVTDTNKLSNEVHKRNFIDFALASLTFENLINDYEGH